MLYIHVYELVMNGNYVCCFCTIVIVSFIQFYSLDILSLLSDGSYALVPAQHIEEQLHKIVESSPTKAQHPVGVLTSEHRDTWYNARERLIQGTTSTYIFV